MRQGSEYCIIYANCDVRTQIMYSFCADDIIITSLSETSVTAVNNVNSQLLKSYLPKVCDGFVHYKKSVPLIRARGPDLECIQCARCVKSTLNRR